MTEGSFWRSVHDLADGAGPAFHMPGHGQRNPFGGASAGVFDERVFGLDQSEMAGLDYLHDPTGPLAASQERAARVFGADRSWYLVNGATVGNLAALWAVARPGGRVLALRRSHQSVHAGVTLAGLEADHLQPLPDERLQGRFGIRLDELRTALEARPGIVAVHVTSPDYYGFLLPLDAIVELCHAHRVPLIVDEAHGAHLSFIAGQPSALAAGADVVVHSPHKALGSLTQSAVLHAQGPLVDPDRISEALVLLQSSSPSALLTMSLDAVVEDLERTGASRWTAQADLARRAVARTGADGLPLLSQRTPLPGGVAGVDPCKLLVDSERYGRSVPEVRDALAGRGIRGELCDRRNLILSVTAGTTPAAVELLLDALDELASSVPRTGSATATAGLSSWPVVPAGRALPARTALQSERRLVPLDRAGGAIVAAPLTPYPPGIPLVLPGEVLTPELVAIVQGFLASDVVVRGLVRDPSGAPAVRCVALPPGDAAPNVDGWDATLADGAARPDRLGPLTLA